MPEHKTFNLWKAFLTCFAACLLANLLTFMAVRYYLRTSVASALEKPSLQMPEIPKSFGGRSKPTEQEKTAASPIEVQKPKAETVQVPEKTASEEDPCLLDSGLDHVEPTKDEVFALANPEDSVHKATVEKFADRKIKLVGFIEWDQAKSSSKALLKVKAYDKELLLPISFDDSPASRAFLRKTKPLSKAGFRDLTVAGTFKNDGGKLSIIDATFLISK